MTHASNEIASRSSFGNPKFSIEALCARSLFLFKIILIKLTFTAFHELFMYNFFVDNNLKRNLQLLSNFLGTRALVKKGTVLK